MNLYKFFDRPEELNFHDEAHEKVPVLFWEKYEHIPAELKKREDQIAKDAEYSYHYAHKILNKPFAKGEDAIAKDGKYSYVYAREVLKTPFTKGENAIAKDAAYSYLYAVYVLNLSDEEADMWAKSQN